jgi:hypothetical protein
MIHGQAAHFLSLADFEGSSLNGSCGVLKGIRDAFLNVNGRKSVKYFLALAQEMTNRVPWEA